MYKVMPKRKFSANGKKGKRSQAQTDNGDGEDAQSSEEEDPIQLDEEGPTESGDGTSAIPDKKAPEIMAEH